ncbi:hypothetical protein [Sulfolobus acidocaldarius]|uniref:hypothetical protein n=1 Tax=Sulfolobus acidocaldarius TaxID=2285 RepID=UPI000B5A9540|nr:hypothetical protein [Sulfolobus acidocaldarius]
MKIITSLTGIKKRPIYIRVPPLFNKSNIARKFNLIELPDEFNDLKEFLALRETLKKAKKENEAKVHVIGNFYVVDLVKGNIKLGESSLVVRGYALTYPYYKAIAYLKSKGVNGNEMAKILDYSCFVLDNYFSYIPLLVREGLKLYTEGKLDESIRLTNRFKRIMYVGRESGKPLEVLKKHYKGNNLKRDWELLPESYKKIIFYLLDSSLGLLPGSSKYELGEIDNVAGEEIDNDQIISPLTFPEFVDLTNYGVRTVTQGKDLIILGPVRSGKSTLSTLIMKRLKEIGFGDVKLIDYHDLEGNFAFIKKIQDDINDGSNFRKIIVLTKDIYYTLKPRGQVIEILDHFLSSPNYNDLLKDYERNIFNYFYNVILDADPNKAIWYIPLVKLAEEYGTPIPYKLGLFTLTKNGRRVGEEDKDIIVEWFSNVNEDIKTYFDDDYVKESQHKVDLDKIIDGLSSYLLTKVKEDSETAIDLLRLYFTEVNENHVLVNSELNKLLLSAGKLYKPSKLAIRKIFNELVDVVSSTRNIDCMELKRDVDPIENIISILVLLRKSENRECISWAYEEILKLKDRTVISDLLSDVISSFNRVGRDKRLANLLSIIIYNLLKEFTPTSIEKILEDLLAVTPFSQIPLSLLYYKTDMIDKIDVKDPLLSTLIYSLLIDYNVRNKELNKVVTLYDKFRKNYTKPKNTQLDLKEFKEVVSYLFSHYQFDKIEDFMDYLKRRADAIIGYTLLLTHPNDESVKGTIELAEKLILPWGEIILKRIKSSTATDEDYMDLLKLYQLQILKSLANNEKYEARLALQGITELSSIVHKIRDDKAKSSIATAITLSKMIIDNKVKILMKVETISDLLVFYSTLFLMGNKNALPLIELLVYQIDKNDLIQYNLFTDLYSLLKGEEIDRNYYNSVMLTLISKYINNTNKVLVLLVTLIGMWHVLGYRGY